MPDRFMHQMDYLMHLQPNKTRTSTSISTSSANSNLSSNPTSRLRSRSSRNSRLARQNYSHRRDQLSLTHRRKRISKPIRKSSIRGPPRTCHTPDLLAQHAVSLSSLKPLPSALKTAQTELGLRRRSRVWPDHPLMNVEGGLVVQELRYRPGYTDNSGETSDIRGGERTFHLLSRDQTRSQNIPSNVLDKNFMNLDPDPDDIKRLIHFRSLLISLEQPQFIASLGTTMSRKQLASLFSHLSAEDLARSLRTGDNNMEGGQCEEGGERRDGKRGILKNREIKSNGEGEERRVRWGRDTFSWPDGEFAQQEQRTGMRSRGMNVAAVIHDLIEFD